MRKHLETLKVALLSAALLASIIAIASIGGDNIKRAWAQGFPYTPNFIGSQSNPSTDFSTPPISYSCPGCGGNGSLGETVPIGSVAYGSFGNATTNTTGQLLGSTVIINSDITVTSVNILNGGTVGTDKGLVAIYNNNGNLVANSALAGATTSGANAFQSYSLVNPTTLVGPGRYWIVYQANGATDNIRTIAASTFIRRTLTIAGAFGTLPATITLPTTFTANVGPIAFFN
jgi:hypothetical protein